MRILATGKLLAAMGVLLCSTTYAADDQLRYSGLEQRLAALEAQVASQNSLQTASYTSDEAATGAACGCSEGAACCVPPSCGCNTFSGGMYFDFEMLWIRPHANEDFADGKLSEEHHFSPRFILGYEDCCGIGARLRYWRFDHNVDVLDPSEIRIGMDVLDVEATNRFCFRKTDVVLGGGIRIADIELEDDFGDSVECDALGLTLAADIRTHLCSYCCNTWSWVYGGRVAILGGDWEGDNFFIDTVVEPQVRDDNLLVHELYAGLEYGYAYQGWDLFSRVTFELQNWHSDVLAQNSNTDSIGYIGPGVSFGVDY